LVNWFKDALRVAAVPGHVHVIDANSMAPALADADLSAVVPGFDSPGYIETVRRLCDEWGITLALSLNDFESSLWAGDSSPFVGTASPVQLIAASPNCQALLEDKAAYGRSFSAAGVRVPRTMLGSEADARQDLLFATDQVVIKHRFGSGSKGLIVCPRGEWRDMLPVVASGARDRNGQPIEDVQLALRAVVIQEMVTGQEYGLDVISDLDGLLQGVLVRRKVRMRSGETDQAVTESADAFQPLASQIHQVTGHRGLIDVDVIVADDGQSYLIDVNPRFGGGYPFSHAAGANVPAAYVAWHLKRPVDSSWLTSRPGVAVSKTEDIRVMSDDQTKVPA
jgi:carbamoyl-phosphate synthase large subunit